LTVDPAGSGWKTWAAQGFTELVGPLWAKREGDAWVYGLLAEPKHANIRGVVHGGALVTLADNALGAMVWEAAGRSPCATIQLDTQFVAPVQPGQFVEARGAVTRRTRSLVFIRGTLSVGGRAVLEAQGIWKVLGTGENP
jgi:uncharacterized protein (TIGR00369 family)